MKKIYYLMAMLFALSIANLNAQVTIGENTDPHSSAALELRTEDKGLLLPRIALAKVSVFQLALSGSDTANDAAGMLIYNTNANVEGGSGTGLYVWDGTAWGKVTGGSSNGGGTDPDEDKEGTINPDGSTNMKVGNNYYKTYNYNGTIWMVQNSMEGTSSAQYHNDDPTRVNGYYYTYAQASQENNACPTGWHLPTVTEWNILKNWVNSNMTLTGATWWVTEAGGAFAGHMMNNVWTQWNSNANWWCGGYANAYYYSSIGAVGGVATTATVPTWMTVRCVKDPDPTPNPDGSVDMEIGNNTYKTYTYTFADNSTMIWMVENSREGTPSATYYSPSQMNGYYYDYNGSSTACPSGWHLPTPAEWTKFKSWMDTFYDHEGGKWWVTAEGNAFAGGYSSFSGFSNWGTNGYWWVANTMSQWGWATAEGVNPVGVPSSFTQYSVRCLKD